MAGRVHSARVGPPHLTAVGVSGSEKEDTCAAVFARLLGQGGDISLLLISHK